jgi:tripartite-type tricarboxylate transporter receptor subunit TctC
MRKPSALALSFFALLAAPLHEAAAQAYPAKPIRFIIPNIAGSAYDMSGRIITAKMGEAMGQSIVAENRAGANGVPAADAVAKSPPDGYVLLWGSPSQNIMAQMISRNVPYDGRKDFTPITLGATSVTVLIANPSAPVGNVKELVELAKRTPGKLTYGSAGIGSIYHLAGESIKQAAGIDIVHVPYKGALQALNDLYGGRIELSMLTLGTALPLHQAGKIRILGLLENTRYAGARDVPTVSETLPAFEKPGSWYALFGPAGMPQPVVQRLYRELAAALKTAEVRAWLDKTFHEGGGNTPEQFAAEYRRSFDVFAKAIKAAGVKAE